MLQFLLPHNLAPHQIISHLWALDVGSLRAKGIRGAAVDYDGVVAKYNSLDPPQVENVAKLAEMGDAGIKVVILSNRRGRFRRSVEHFLPNYVLIASRRKKPHRESFETALLELKTLPEETVFIDDCLVTGIAGGNRAGLYTIWVTHHENEEPFKLKILRALERLLLRLYIVFDLVPERF